MPEEKKEANAELEELLGELAGTGDIEASAIVRRDGLMIASDLPGKIDSRAIAAMAAAMVGTAETCSAELRRGAFQHVVIESELGKIVSVGAGGLALLVCLVKPAGNIGLVLLAMSKAAKKIAETLGESTTDQ